MPAHRFFLENSLSHSTATLSGAEFHHLKHVMRVKTGETVELVNGKGTLAYAKLLEIKKDEAVFEIEKQIQSPPPACEIILAQALTKPALLDWIVEKGTELGVTQFWLFPGEWSEKKELSAHQLQRLHTLLVGALKQCGRLYLPTIELKPLLSHWKKPSQALFFGSLSPNTAPFPSNLPSSVIMVIGPEKGLSSEEHRLLEMQLGGKGVSLHPNILRAETAALCALSLLSYKLLF